MRPETRDEFEVAIICALPLEAAAVLNSLDERYDKNGSEYGKQEGDTNTYSTGRIGQHSVVLAHMPGIGISSAAKVASKMQLSFRGIRLALIVGVCGGVPFERPTPAIVLGDVIISNSVIEFDFGRLYPNRSERKTGLEDTLGRPNPEIRGLLSKFKIPSIRLELEEAILQNLARLQEKGNAAKYPGAEHDRLFPTSYHHIHRRETASQSCPCYSSQSNSNASCSEALESSCDMLGCSVDGLDSPSRRMRFTSGAPTPLVHLGTIGSANAVMKCGEYRDAMASKDNIIAFEMEGAGVWDDLPCLLIKGVCDYADSHKNKVWQNYAAATAASAAKAFLDYWTSGQHNSNTRQGSSRKRRLSLSPREDFSSPNGARRTPSPRRQNAVISVVPMTDHINTGFRPPPALVDPHARRIRLDALNFERLDARQTTIKTAYAATCEWVLSKSEYLDWQSEDKILEHHGFLWIKGKPGAGKSTIMKFAYTNARENPGRSVVISYFYNARGDHLEKSICGMYRSLLFQLLGSVPRLQDVLDSSEAAQLQTMSTDPRATQVLQSLFSQAIKKLKEQPLICFVDALDECENNDDEVREMVRFFEVLGECAITDNIRFLVCFASRHYPHITIHKSVELILETQPGHSDDIKRYIRSRLRIGGGTRVDRIKTDVQNKSQGIFLWVVLVLPMLQKAYDNGQVHALGNCLEGIPEGLDELFQNVSGKDTENLENLKLCLKWVFYAVRPLSPKELYFAMLSTPDSECVATWDPEDVTTADMKRFILSSSKGLVEPTLSRNPTIQFIHESVRDFLFKASGSALQADKNFASAGLVHDFLKHSCQRYLASIPYNTIEGFWHENEIEFPFLSYSMRNILRHAESAASLGVPQEAFLEEFPLSCWTALHDWIEQYDIDQYGSGISLLYVLIQENLLHLFQIEVRRSQSINLKGGPYDYPLIAAAVFGNNQMLELLLQYGADHTKRGSRYIHALHAAVGEFDAPAVAMLIAHGAVPAANDSVPQQLVEVAVLRREVVLLKLLLGNRSLIASSFFDTEDFEILVQQAVQDEDQKMLELFVELGVIGENHPHRLAHTLCWAATSGDQALVQRCIKLGANFNVPSRSGTVLGAASELGQESMVRFLIEGGADVNALHIDPFEDRTTALFLASFMGKHTVVPILLEHGADVNQESPLFGAVSFGSETITRTLLEHGANPNQCKIFGGSEMTHLPLHQALDRGQPDIVRLLLDHGADVNISSSAHKNAFSALDSCLDQEMHNVCEQLLHERNFVRPQTPIESGSTTSHTSIIHTRGRQDSVPQSPCQFQQPDTSQDG